MHNNTNQERTVTQPTSLKASLASALAGPYGYLYEDAADALNAVSAVELGDDEADYSRRLLLAATKAASLLKLADEEVAYIALFGERLS